MRSYTQTTRLAVVIASLMLLGGCAAAATPSPSASPTAASVGPSPSMPSPVGPASPSASPAATVGPTGSPTAGGDQATRMTDILLRFDNGPDHALSELTMEQFRPGPEFTLYGDGTVIFRDEGDTATWVEGPILRALPFKTGRLDAAQVQSLLQFALDEGGLRSAPESNGLCCAVDDPGRSLFVIRVGGIDKRVEVVGSTEPFEALADVLRNLDREAAFTTRVWEGERFQGELRVAGPWIELGLLPDARDAGVVPWPWAGIAPEDFMGLNDMVEGRREMSAVEAAVLGLSDHGGLVRRAYLRGPDDQTIYSFSLWPVPPDEPS